MAQAVAQTEAQTAPSTSTVQVRLVTKTETPISSTPIIIPTSVTRYSLSQILNHLLENPQPIPYSFLINSAYLPSSLDEYITENGLSREEILEIEYVRSVLPPQWEAQWTQEDWVSGVSVRDEGIVSSGYDGVVRVWDWSGNVIAKSKVAQGALRALKCVKWIERGLVTGGMDGSVRVWSHSDTGVSLTVEGKGHDGSVDSVDYRDGRIISAGPDGSLRVWSLDPSEADVPQSQRKRRKTDSMHTIRVQVLFRGFSNASHR
jgi:ribosome biogenesis protein